MRNALSICIVVVCVLAILSGCAGTTATSSPAATGGDSLDELIQSGNNLATQGDYQAAIQQYNRALAKDISSADAHGNLGVAFYYAGRYNEAIREAQQAIVMAPTEINWRFNLGAAYSKKGDYERAVAAYEAAVGLARRMPDENRYFLRSALIGLGRSHELAGQHDGALDAYREALVFAPDDMELLAGVGNIYFRQGKLVEAEDAYQQVLVKDPTHQMATYNLGLVYARTGRYDKAIALFSTEDLPETVLGAIGDNSLDRADRTRAAQIAAFRSQLGKMGSSAPQPVRSAKPPPYTYALGITYYEQGNDTEALNAFSRALQEDPALASAHLYLGNIYTRQGQISEAMAAYQDALRIDPGFPEAYNNLGSLYAEQGKIDDAKAAYKQALERNIRFHDARTNLGLLYAETGQYEEAIREYQAVINSGAGIAEAHNNLGIIYLRQGRIEEAIAESKKAIGLRRNYPEPYNNLGLTYGQNAYFNDIIDTWWTIAAVWTGDQIRPESAVSSDWILLRRVPARSSDVGGAPREYYRKGVGLAVQGLFDDAARAFQAALTARPEWHAAQLAIGSIYLAQERWPDAAAALTAAVALNPSDPLAHASLAIALALGGDYNGAVMAWEQVVKYAGEPERQAARDALSLVRERLKNTDNAIEALTRAIELNPDFAKAYFNLGALYDQIHRYQDAVNAYERVAALEPDIPAIHFRLGIAYSRVGRQDDARAAIQRYIQGVTDPMELPQVETFLKRIGN